MRLGRMCDPRAWFKSVLVLCIASLVTGCSAAIAPAAFKVDAVRTSASVSAGIDAPAPDVDQLQSQLQEYLARQKGTYGVYVVDLVTGESLGINDDKVFPAASTFKLPMSLYILDLAARGKVSLDEKIAYTRADYEAGTGTLQDWIKPGKALTVRELIGLAITQSDNIATQMLLRRFGVQNVYACMKRLGGKVTHYEPGVVGTTPREMAAYMRSAEGTAVISDATLRAFLMEALENTAFDDRTAAGVPDGVTVAHKIGTLPNVVNDVALIEAPGHPFIISAFSMNVDDTVAPEVIEEVTRKVYDFFNAS